MKNNATSKQLVEQMRQNRQHKVLLEELIEHNLKVEETLSRIEMHYDAQLCYQAESEHYKSYSTLLLTLGYAGYFAIWGFSREFLTDSASVWSATFLGASLMLFIFWEVFVTAAGMFKISRKRLAVSKIEPTKRTLSEWLHPYIWVLTVTTALIGSLMLFYNFLAILFELPLWPTDAVK